MKDIRGAIGAWGLKFFKIGRLTYGGEANALRDAFIGKDVTEDNLWRAYSTNVWAYRGINAIAEAMGQLPIRVVQSSSSGALKPVENHPFVKLVENPNPFMTRQDLVELLMIFCESTGDGYWLFDDGAAGGRTPGSKLKLSQVKEIWPLPSHQMTAIPDERDFIKNYNFKPNAAGKGDDFSVEEVLHVRYPNPATLLYGQGAIKPVTGDLAADAYAMAFERFIMKNLAANIVFLKTDSGFTADQREEYRRSLAQVFKGVRIGFMENGLDFATPQIAAKDLPFLELDTRRQKRILGALGVPPLLAGSEDAKYDNAEQQLRVFWDNRMAPKITRIATMLTKKLHAMGESDRLSVIFDTSGVKALQADMKVQAETAKLWVDMGVPVNDAIKVFGVKGLEEVDGGDVGLVSSSLIPITDAIEPPEPEPEGTAEDAPPPGEGPDDDEPADDTPKPPKKKGLARDKAIDDAHWKRFINNTEPGFRRLRVALRQLFKEQRAQVMSALADTERAFHAQTKDPRVQLIVIDVDVEAKKFQKKTEPILKSIYRKLGEEAIADIGVSIDFNIGSPLAAEFLADHVFKFSFQVNRTTKDRLTAILQDKFTTGATQGDITKAIMAEFDFAERYRAARIARTESGIAGNSGYFDGMRQAGVETKRWISARDAKVRHTHEVADGQEVAINEPFDVGGELLDYPGDPSGSAENIINCRCAVRAARQKQEKTMNRLILAAALALAAAAPARAQAPGTVNVEQDVIRSTVTIYSVNLAQSFIMVDTGPSGSAGHMSDSWFVEVQNLSSEQVCCAFDTAATTGLGSLKSCVRIDTAPTASASGFVAWKRFKRFAQNLNLFCRSLKSSGSAEIIVTQGK